MDRTLLALSAAALLTGLVFPVATIVANPFFGYLIMFVSWPAWAFGAYAAGIVGYRAEHQLAPSALYRWGWGLCFSNAGAALATLIMPFPSSS